ncbi:MAG: hypothetical protein WC284_18365 [Candidimonas sp.]
MKQLPLWMLRCNPNYIRTCYDHNDHSILKEAFNWNMTDQGFSYWYDIVHHGHTPESQSILKEMVNLINMYDLTYISYKFSKITNEINKVPLNFPIVVTNDKITSELGYFDFSVHTKYNFFTKNRFGSETVLLALSVFSDMCGNSRRIYDREITSLTRHFQYGKTIMFTDHFIIIDGKKYL